MFVDEVEIRVESGKGGNGCVSFRREKYVPRGGPDGGDGGDGGSVIVVAQQGVDSLSALAHRKHWKAASGQPGRGANCHGASADDLLIRVPPGTLVIDEKRGHVLKDLAADAERVTVARGGKGGKGNTRFKSATNQAPRQSTPGGPGEVRLLRLRLKVIADVGLVEMVEEIPRPFEPLERFADLRVGGQERLDPADALIVQLAVEISHELLLQGGPVGGRIDVG